MRSRIVIVDDHQIVLEGLKLVFKQRTDVELVGEATTGADAVRLVNELKPDIVVMDMDMPVINGIVLSRQIFREHPGTKVIILSAHTEARYVQEAVQAGVSGYLSKENHPQEIGLALKAAREGKVYLCTAAATVLAKDYRARMATEGSQLSEREVEVLKQIAEGRSTKEIAFGLQVSVKTVETHRANIMEKLNLHTVAELTKYAIRQGLTSL